MKRELAEAIANEQIEHAIASGVFHDDFRIVKREYPLLVIRAKSMKRDLVFFIRFELSDYDHVAPQVRNVNELGIEIFNPFPLRAGSQNFPNHGPAGLAQFFCIEGTRDYYTHPSHLPQQTGKSWETHRSEFPLHRILDEFSRRFQTGEMC
jgi:hypothetical protein